MSDKTKTYTIDLKDIYFLPEDQTWMISFPPIVLKNMYEIYITASITGELYTKMKEVPEGQILAFTVEYEDTTFVMQLPYLQHGKFIGIFAAFNATGWTEEDNHDLSMVSSKIIGADSIQQGILKGEGENQ